MAAEALQDANPGAGDPKADQPAEAGEEKILDEKLACQTGAARAERRPDRELVHAPGRPHQREVGDVHAGE
jgi:hypothetical protein